MAYLIRHARRDDIPTLVALLQDLFSLEQDFTSDQSKQTNALMLLLSDSRCCVFVAEHNDQIVGMCSLQVLLSTAEGGYVGLIEDVVVAGEHRGQGIGKRLLASLESWAEQRGLLRLQLLADSENHHALDFYRASEWSNTHLIALRKYLPDTDKIHAIF